MERGNGERHFFPFFFSRLMLVLVRQVIFTNCLLYSTYLKGLPNGFNHEKKGNKRPQAEERLVVKPFICLFYFLLFFIFSFILLFLWLFVKTPSLDYLIYAACLLHFFIQNRINLRK